MTKHVKFNLAYVVVVTAVGLVAWSWWGSVVLGTTVALMFGIFALIDRSAR